MGSPFQPVHHSGPDYLPEFFVWWDTVTQAHADLLRQRIEKASREADMQAFLQSNPHFLIQHLGGGHGRWVIPQKRLGAEHVPDFVIGQRDSMGFRWEVVELESPVVHVFNKNGDPSRWLNHAIRQVTDWRAWLRRNQDYASRPREAGGLGLTDIDMNSRGLIIIGRREQIDASTKDRRRQLSDELAVDIHSYDWLLSTVEGRIDALERFRQGTIAS